MHTQVNNNIASFPALHGNHGNLNQQCVWGSIQLWFYADKSSKVLLTSVQQWAVLLMVKQQLLKEKLAFAIMKQRRSDM